VRPCVCFCAGQEAAVPLLLLLLFYYFFFLTSIRLRLSPFPHLRTLIRLVILSPWISEVSRAQRVVGWWCELHKPVLLGDPRMQKAEFTSGPWGCHRKLAWSDCRVAEILRSGGYFAFLDAHFVSPSLSHGIRSWDVIIKRPYFDVKSRIGQLDLERWDLWTPWSVFYFWLFHVYSSDSSVRFVKCWRHL